MNRLIIVLTMCFGYAGVNMAHAQYDLIGVWKLDSHKMLDLLKKDASFDSLPSQFKQRINDDIYSRSFIFNDPDVALITFVSQGSIKKITGVWSYNANTQEVQISAENRTRKYSVHWEDSNTIQLIPTTVAHKEVFKSIYLKRQD